MKKLALFTILALVLAAAPARAEDPKWLQWKKSFQAQTGTGEAEAVKQQLDDKYGALTEEQAQAIRDRLEKVQSENATPEQRAANFEAWQQQHPEIAETLTGTNEERRQKWEDWKAEHQADAANLETRRDRVRQQVEELQGVVETEGEHAQTKKWHDLKFHNRDEALGAYRKYKDWKAENPQAVEQFKQKAAEMAQPDE